MLNNVRQVALQNWRWSETAGSYWNTQEPLKS